MRNLTLEATFCEESGVGVIFGGRFVRNPAYWMTFCEGSDFTVGFCEESDFANVIL